MRRISIVWKGSARTRAKMIPLSARNAYFVEGGRKAIRPTHSRLCSSEGANAVTWPHPSVPHQAGDDLVGRIDTSLPTRNQNPFTLWVYRTGHEFVTRLSPQNAVLGLTGNKSCQSVSKIKGRVCCTLAPVGALRDMKKFKHLAAGLARKSLWEIARRYGSGG